MVAPCASSTAYFQRSPFIGWYVSGVPGTDAVFSVETYFPTQRRRISTLLDRVTGGDDVPVRFSSVMREMGNC